MMTYIQYTYILYKAYVAYDITVSHSASVAAVGTLTARKRISWRTVYLSEVAFYCIRTQEAHTRRVQGRNNNNDISQAI